MKIIYLSLVILMTSACSTLKRTLVYSSLIGGVAGAASGVVLSPNRQNRQANALVFGAVGAVATGLVGLLLFKDDPRNYKLDHMLMGKNGKNKKLDIDLGALQIDANLKPSNVYNVPVTSLPEKLKGKINKQYLIKYQSKERYINQGKKTYYIPEFEVYEHAYGKNLTE